MDCRLSNTHFDEPEDVNLATGATMGSIEVDSAAPVALGQVDIADAFYALALPSDLTRFFGL
eukprot:9494070-Pyramimonas_sp.AAC.1